MPYNIKENGKQVLLYVLVGADPSLEGLRVRNCSIISMTFPELHDIVFRTMGKREENHFIISLFSHHVGISPDSNLMVLENIIEDENDLDVSENLLKALKLYQSGDIYSCYFTSYRFRDGKLNCGGIAINLKYSHAIGFISPHYILTDEQKTFFPEWHESIFKELISLNRSDSYRAMVRMYDTSYLIGICESEYIMLFSILEMLFGSGKTEITYQISRGTALILSETPDEMHTIYRKMKKLYSVRSEYVHNGKPVPHERLFELRELVRKVMVKVAQLGYHTKEKTFEELREKILLGGYPSFTDKKKEV